MRRLFFAVGTVVALSTKPLPIFAQGPFGYPICRPPGTQDQVAVASRSDGSLAVIVWRDARNDPGDPWDIYGQAIAPAPGGIIAFQWALGDTGIAICGASNAQRQPRVAIDASGNAWVVWHDIRSCSGGDPPGDGEIYAQGIDPAGNALCATSGFKIHTTNCPQPRRNPNIMALDDGAVGAWGHWIPATVHHSYVRLQRFDSGCGALWDAAGTVAYDLGTTNRNRAPKELAPAIIADGAGGVIAVFEDQNDNNFNGYVYASRVDLSGTVLWSGVRLCLTAGTAQGPSTPSIVGDGSGGVIAVWEQGAVGSRTIRGQRIDATGARKWGDCGKDIASGPGDHRNAVIVPSTLGRFFMLWEAGSSTDADIYAQRINFPGDTLSTRIPVCTASFAQTKPRAAAGNDGTGKCYVVWEDNRQEAIGDGGDIYMQLINADGTMSGQTDGVPVCNLAPSRQYDPRVVSWGQGGALIVWSDLRNGNPDIYAQGFVNVVAVEVEDLAALPFDGGVRLSWRLSREAVTNLVGVVVQRSDNNNRDGLYEEMTLDPLPAEAVMSYDDLAPASGDRWYRLKLARHDGTHVVTHAVRAAHGDAWARTELTVVWGSTSAASVPIRYRIARSGTPVTLGVYDMRGRLVRTLVADRRERGEHLRMWDRHDETGRGVAGGVYVVRLVAGGDRIAKKLVLVP